MLSCVSFTRGWRANARSSRHQDPSSKEFSNAQCPSHRHWNFADLRFGASLDLGAWCLDLLFDDPPRPPRSLLVARAARVAARRVVAGAAARAGAVGAVRGGLASAIARGALPLAGGA